MADRRPLVREELLESDRGAVTEPETLAVQRKCYQLDELGRWMATLESRTGSWERAIPERRVEDAGDGYRAAVEEQLEQALDDQRLMGRFVPSEKRVPPMSGHGRVSR